MPVTVVASGFPGAPGGETANGASHGPIASAAILAGDWLVAGPTIAGGSTTVKANGFGWEEEPAQAIATRSGYATHAFAKQLTADDAGDPLTFVTNSSIKAATPWIILRGLKPGQTPVFRTPVTGLAAAAMTPPAFTPAPGKVLVHLIGIATAAAAPPSLGQWTTPTGITLAQAATMGGTSGRAGAAIGVQLNENVGISGDWDSDASSSWGIVAIEFEVADDTPVPVPATVYAGAAEFDWQDQAAADALFSPAPTLSTSVGSASSIAGATLVAPSDARFRYRGAAGMAYGSGTPDSSCYQPSSRYPNGWGNPATFAVAFLHTGTEFELLFKWLSAAGAGWFRISVDGQRLTDLMYDIPGTTGGSMHKTKVTFPTSATRHILVEVQGVPFAGVYVGAGNSITEPPAFSFRMLVQGDSTSAGSDGNTGGGAGTWVARLGRYAGVNVDVWNQAIGTTGMVAAGTSVSIPNRLADVTAYAPDVVILWCGGNDGSTSIVAEATQWIADVKAAAPGVRPIIVGTWSPTVSPSAARAARSTDLKNAAAANGVPFIEPITGQVIDAAGNLVASQGPWIASSGDVATYVYSGDNVHPTDAGHAYIAKRMMQAMQALGSPMRLAIATPAPAVSAAASVAPPAAVLETSIAAPTVSAAAAIESPVTGATVTAHAPSVSAGATVSAPAAVLTAAAQPPSVSAGAALQAVPSELTVTATPPAVTAGGAAAVAAPTGVLEVAVHAPTVTAAATLRPAVAELTAETPPPAVSAGGAATVAPPVAEAHAVALTPTVRAAATVTAPTVTVIIAGHPPTLSAAARLSLPRATLEVTVHPPLISDGRVVVPAIRRLRGTARDRRLTGLAPDRRLEGRIE